MKSNSRIISFSIMLTLMSMGFTQDLKYLGNQVDQKQDLAIWKSNVALSTKTY